MYIRALLSSLHYTVLALLIQHKPQWYVSISKHWVNKRLLNRKKKKRKREHCLDLKAQKRNEIYLPDNSILIFMKKYKIWFYSPSVESWTTVPHLKMSQNAVYLKTFTHAKICTMKLRPHEHRWLCFFHWLSPLENVQEKILPMGTRKTNS